MIKLFLNTLFLIMLGLISSKALAWDCDTLSKRFAQVQTQPADETLNLQLINSTESTSPQTREIIIKRKTGSHKTEMVLVKVIKPAELQGISMLAKVTEDHKVLQWLYLPQNQQTKRILDSQKGSNFAGSEFSYSDLMPFDWNQYSCEKVLTDTPSKLQVQLKPFENSNLNITLQLELDPQTLQMQRIQFYDDQNALVRTATFEDYRNITTNIVRPFRVTMLNHKRNRKSILQILNINLNSGLRDSEFSLKAMTR